MDFDSLFPRLVQHHIATVSQPHPMTMGVSWMWANNGIFKRGANPSMDIIIQVARGCAVPGLTNILPRVRWATWGSRLPATLLTALLSDAQHAAVTVNGVARPIEKQYFIVYRDDTVRLVAPKAQRGTATTLHYVMPCDGCVLVDIHSHHALAGGAFFSATDTHDDAGLGVSIVIGHILTQPEIVCRLNVYGDHQIVPAMTLFDGLGPFRDRGADDAITDR